MTLAMIDGESVVLVWREADVDAVLAAAYDMGLPVAASWAVLEARG